MNKPNNSVSTSNKQEVVSITYEEIGLFPRSFSRVFDRFLKQIFSDVENLVIQEYRFYRYLFLTTLKCLFILFFVPFLVNFVCKNYLIRPLTEYFWNTKQTEIFLNSYQQKHAFAELKDFEAKLYFAGFVQLASESKENFFDKNYTSYSILNKEEVASTFSSEQKLSLEAIKPSLTSFSSQNLPYASLENLNENIFGKDSEKQLFLWKNYISPVNAVQNYPILANLNAQRPAGAIFEDQKKLKNGDLIYSTSFVSFGLENLAPQLLQEKLVFLAEKYNNQSIENITNFFADVFSLLTLFYLLYALEIQINITKSFLLEVFFGLDDSKKSLLILLTTDLLVGYHSSNLWELFFEFIFHHYGLPESQTGIFLLVATLPVLLDVLFKYLIFRHLNRSSPATVATYRAMIE